MKDTRRNEIKVNIVTERHNNVVPNQISPDTKSDTVPGIKKPNQVHVPVDYVR